MKRTLLLIIALVLLLTLPAAAYDLDSGYSVAIDAFTGLPVGENTVISEEDTVPMNGSAYFDGKDRMFVYQLPGTESRVRCSVADGMMTNSVVSVFIPEGVDYTLYRDGVLLEAPDLNNLREEGIYDLNMTGQSSLRIRFTIVRVKTADIISYRLPDDFEVLEVQRDGETIMTPANMVDLTLEGSYEITYRNRLTGIPYHLSLPIDRTPPTLALEAVVDGVAKGPVDLSDVEEGATLLVELDGEEIITSELLQSGNYVVTVTDQAGNKTVYKFTLQIYFNLNSILFFILFPAMIVGLIAYLSYAKKHLRVR